MCAFVRGQETPDYGRPVSVVVEAGIQSVDDGPVLDPDQPSILRAEVSLCFIHKRILLLFVRKISASKLLFGDINNLFN